MIARKLRRRGAGRCWWGVQTIYCYHARLGANRLGTLVERKVRASPRVSVGDLIKQTTQTSRLVTDMYII